jgi:hypothetical protein
MASRDAPPDGGSGGRPRERARAPRVSGALRIPDEPAILRADNKSEMHATDLTGRE